MSLCLTRRVNQSIVIGEDIVVTVIESKNGKVRLGIEAPAHIPVHRGEIHREIQKQKSRDKDGC